ncbi:MAG: hypothetical protein WA888_11070 [Burkholderiaceae bacterium]
MGSAYEWFDQKRTMEILDESQVVPDSRAKELVTNENNTPLPEMRRATEHWYSTLPDKVKPTALRCKFPHILEQIHRAWESPRQVHKLFSGLMVDDRGSRKGFPFAAIREVHALKDYYFEVLQPDAKHLLDPKGGLNTMR